LAIPVAFSAVEPVEVLLLPVKVAGKERVPALFKRPIWKVMERAPAVQVAFVQRRKTSEIPRVAAPVPAS
jgi:hypothetical protein